MKTLAIIIGFLPNPRIYKRIALEKQLYNVHLICWDRGTDMQNKPSEDGYIVHCITEQASADPIKRILPYKRFFKKSMDILREISPNIIHVQGIDMLNVACKYKNKHKSDIHIIYEVADLHRLLVDKQKSIIKRAAQRYLKCLDKKRCKEIELLIVTSEKYVEKYFGAFVSQKKIFVFPNLPDLSAFKNYKKKAEIATFTVGFIGDIRYPRQMKNLISAARACNMNILFAGFEQCGNEIEKLCEDYEKAEWYGRFDFKTEAAKLYEKCDVIYSVYDADMENVKVAIPNKFYESVYCELPIIVAKNTYLSELVEQWGVGVSVNHKDVEELKKVLISLSTDRDIYDKISRNCILHREMIDIEPYNNKFKLVLKSF